MPRRRGLATVLNIDEMGATAKFQVQSFRVTQDCVRKCVGPRDLGEVDWVPASGRLGESPVWPPWVSEACVGGDATERARGGGRGASGSGFVQFVLSGDGDSQGPSPLLSGQISSFSPRLVALPSSPSSPVQLLLLGSSFGRNCLGKVAPRDTGRDCENLTYDEFCRLRSRRGYARGDSEAALKTR